MAVLQTEGQLLDTDLGWAFESQFQAENIAEPRQEVFRKVAGQWALQNVQLPESLDVPGVLTYASVDELLVGLSPWEIRETYRTYTAQQEAGIMNVLADFDPRSEADLLVAGTATAVGLETRRRLEGYEATLTAMGKPTEPIADLIGEGSGVAAAVTHDHDTIIDLLSAHLATGKKDPARLLPSLLLEGKTITRMQLNVERDAALDTIAGRPITGATYNLPRLEPRTWRQNLQNFLRRR
jgi:hypothetical protein